MNSGEDN